MKFKKQNKKRNQHKAKERHPCVFLNCTDPKCPMIGRMKRVPTTVVPLPVPSLDQPMGLPRSENISLHVPSLDLGPPLLPRSFF
jgi:hypothetical protein